MQPLRECAKEWPRSVVLPKLIVERMLPQLQVHLNVAPESSQFWRPIEIMPATIPAQDRKRLADAYRVKIARVIQPAYQRLYDFLSQEYAPHARQTAGLGALPGGKDLYRYYVRYHTTTDMTPKDIHELGLAQVREISGQLAAIEKQWASRARCRSFSPTFAMIRNSTSVGRKRCCRHFRRRVIASFRICRRCSVCCQKRHTKCARCLTHIVSRGITAITLRPPRTGRGRVLWINIYAPGVQDKFNLMTISLHEGLPGHHFQTSIASERQDLPSFRRFDPTNAYVEGWGLYAESLGQEMGFYSDPWQLLRTSQLRHSARQPAGHRHRHS